jgi:hypothetical protein
MHQLLPTKSHEEKMQKSEEEHSFSDELNGKWIKILNLNKTRKKKKCKENSTWRISKSKGTKLQQKVKKRSKSAKKKNW